MTDLMHIPEHKPFQIDKDQSYSEIKTLSRTIFLEVYDVTTIKKN